MSVNLYAVTLDCSNAMDQAKFWSAVLDKPVVEGATEEFAAIGLQDPPNPPPALSQRGLGRGVVMSSSYVTGKVKPGTVT